MCGGAVPWRSKKQSSIALSSVEAEYISSCTASKEAIWLSNVLKEILHTSNTTPIHLLVDSSGSISSAHNEPINDRNKHIDIRYHFVRHPIADKKITMSYCPTNDQTADILTKPCLLYTSPSPRDQRGSRMPSSA